MGAENLDPLGLGRIDTRQLALVRPCSCTAVLARSCMQSLLGFENRDSAAGLGRQPCDCVEANTRYYSLCEDFLHVLQVRSEHRVLGRAKTVRGGPAPKVTPFVIYLPSSGTNWTAAAAQ